MVRKICIVYKGFISKLKEGKDEEVFLDASGRGYVYLEW